MTIADYIKAENITQREFADRIGCTYEYLNRIIKGQRPGWKLALKIQEVSKGKVSRKNWYK